MFTKLLKKYYDEGYKSGRWHGVQEGYKEGKRRGYESGFAEATKGGVIINEYGMFIAKSSELFESVLNGGVSEFRKQLTDD